ncbi:VENN motif-containing pre-toxin protein, partial [Bibersteinia trehalosi]|uniref:VENN motif pre-toxin domain-containing protein n=1 Tax=Bibersteinia trehalosi TaxID=47735 RepID=UPI0010EC356C
FAEDGGYGINANNVELIAGAIASSNPENSELATNKLSFRDIENQSSSEALSAGVSASVNLNKAVGTEAKTEAQAEQQAQTAKLTGTPQSNGISPSIPMFNSSEERSITKATLTEGKITLNKDSNPTQTTAKALGINTDLSQANREVAGLKDINQTLREQQILSQAAGNVAEAVMTYAENQKAELQQAEQNARKSAEQAANAGDSATARAKLQEAEQLKAEVERWETGGDHKRKATAVAAALSLAVAGKPAEAIAAGAASPYLNEAIKHITENTDNKALEALNVPLHILWGAVEAELAGGSATVGAVAAGVGELGAKVLAETVYGKQPSELNEEEKQNLLNASKALAGIASGVVSGGNGAETLANASVGMVVAENAVENNALNASDSVNYLRDLSEAYKKGESLEVVHEKYAILSQREFEKDIDACKNGGLMCYVGVLSAMKAGVDSIEGYKDFYALPTEIKQEAVDWVSSEAAKHSIEFIDGSPTAIYLALTAIEIAQEMYEAKNAGRNFSVDKAQAKFAQKINAYNPHKHSVGNMNDFLKNKEFGQNLSQILTKTSKRYQGQTIYEVNKSELGFKKGDQIYLDNLHKDHLEVFDRNGNFKGVYNLDGSLNAEKTKNSYGRKLSK